MPNPLPEWVYKQRLQELWAEIRSAETKTKERAAREMFLAVAANCRRAHPKKVKLSNHATP